MPIDDLKALAVFARTVEHGSFRGAARALSLSPSVVSHHVSRLERRLGTPLLYRTTRQLALTPDGERLYASAHEMLEAAERGLDAAAGHGASPVGRLRLTAPALLAETRFCRDLAAFARRHPQVSLSVDFSERRRDLIRDGLDLALRIGHLEDSGFVARRLTVMPRVLVAAPDYVAARPPAGALRDLEGWDVLQLTPRAPELALLPPGRKRPLTLAYRPRISLDSATALREMALAGVGVTTIPRLLVEQDLTRGRLVEVLPGWRLPDVTVYAVWPGGTPRRDLTTRFVDFIEPRLVALFG